MPYIRCLLFERFIFVFESVSFVRKRKTVIEIAQNNAFITLIIFKKNVVSIASNNITINVKK